MGLIQRILLVPPGPPWHSDATARQGSQGNTTQGVCYNIVLPH